ncbi:MAG: 23S rRNA (uracil(1939)-C(5))-methyltransferase RlmD [Syntrophotaleaceae bacterium]
MIIDELHIESLAYGGAGLGRHEGRVVFVPFTAPGDRVRCRIIREKKRYAEGVAEQILVPSAERRQACCPVFGQCGGCQWQHLSYSGQGSWKETIFSSLLNKQAGIDPAVMRPLACAPDEWTYRSRAQVKIRQAQNRLVMGFYRPGSHYVANTESCPILHPLLNRTWSLFRQRLIECPDAAKIPQLDLETDDTGQVRAVLHYIGNQSEPIKEFFGTMSAVANLSLFLQSGRKDTLTKLFGRENLTIEVDDPPLKLQYGAGGFAQVNLEQNRALVREVASLFPSGSRWRVLDLFCGMGNFSLPVARRAEKVIGVENFAPAIDQARRNAEANGLTNVEFHARPAEGAATALWPENGFDMVMLDPPRSGAYEVIRELARLKPARILYISCDPPTLARDLVPLLHSGYQLGWSRPYDLFPQTHHTESVTLLSRQDF